jgi:citrate synthase
MAESTSAATAEGNGTASLSVRDNRTGREYDIPVADGVIRGSDLAKIKTSDDEPGLALYDPGFVNTASCRSAITFIDGDKGILEYRGYPIEQLAGSATYLEVAYLLIHGNLPDKSEYEQWVHEITYHTFVHENMKSLMQGFRYDAHPMGMLLSAVGACRRSTPRRATSPTRRTSTCRRYGSSPRCRRWAPGRSATRRASRTSTPTTSCPTPRTSWRCCSR